MIIDEDKYDHLFANAHRALKQEYRRHEPQKSDSWEKMPIEELQKLYEGTFTMVEWIVSSDYNIDRLIDRVLLELMILERQLKKEE